MPSILTYLLPSDPEDPTRLTNNTRALGLAVCRSTTIVLICPEDGMEEIANPFLEEEG
jgi:U6 snRNA-associated Sm-like protein LSm7